MKVLANDGISAKAKAALDYLKIPYGGVVANTPDNRGDGQFSGSKEVSFSHLVAKLPCRHERAYMYI